MIVRYEIELRTCMSSDETFLVVFDQHRLRQAPADSIL
jgi:hypothetical protein